MKKIILIVSLLMSVTLMFGQKGKVTSAYNLVTIEPADFETAKANIEEALVNPETKDWSKTWFTAGYIYEKVLEDQQKKEITKSDDKKLRGESTIKAYDYFVKAYELDQLPNEKGVVKPKYTKNIITYMKTYQIELFNYGVLLYGEKNYKGAVDAWEKYLDMPNLPFLKDAGIGGPTDSIYIFATYYTATGSIINEDNDKAIKYLELVKDKYMINESYQFLAQQYLAKKDTVNYFNTIKTGFEKYPTNSFLLESLINYYIYFSGKVEDAIVYLDEAIKLNPQMSQYYFVKANLCEVKDLNEDALINFKKTLELEPKNAGAYAGVGRYYYKKGDAQLRKTDNIRDMQLAKVETDKANDYYKEAIPYFEKSRELDPNNIDNLKLLRSLYYKIYRDENNSKYAEINKAIKALELK